ncbi:MAG: alkaline phosphatase family protein [Planctomycetota bacterium]|nr:MAG: alkaline phosphatase family protein [Planctomycetota bacterium]REK39415.1 MAG: alkaline phosphatase family protein [Planctomycetota bacterium]
MSDHVVLLSIPGLRARDLAAMPNLGRLATAGEQVTLVPSFPAVTWPVQANLLTGKGPAEHGVVANGFYWRDQLEVEMWTATNDKVGAPQIWDYLHRHDPSLTSAVWFPMLSKQCAADYVCMPAPIHNPDGSESLWCYTKPTELYGELRDEFGHFPLQHFWGPLAGIQSSAWIADSAAYAARKFRPNFFYIYLTHLDYAAQKSGPDSRAAAAAVAELDELLGRMLPAFEEVFAGERLLWLVASEYTISPVDQVTYPNRVLREAGLLSVRNEAEGDGELIDFAASDAWALADHQLSHVYVRDSDPAIVARAAELFRGRSGFAQVLAGDERAEFDVSHPNSGDVVLISDANSWQAYYYWLDDARAPSFARTVDIHRKPGYDPVELHFDMATKSIPLDATLVKGSHGAPVSTEDAEGVLISSEVGVLLDRATADTQVADFVLRQFGV